MLFRRGTAHYLQRLLYMQRARFAVRSHAAVIVHTVGHVGVLLHFNHHNTLADSVQRAGRDKEAIAFFTGTAFSTSVRVLFRMRSSSSSRLISWSKP